MSNYNKYTIIAFFPRRQPLKWKYVYSIKSAAASLTNSYPTWQYINVYNRETSEYLGRFYPENDIPKFI